MRPLLMSRKLSLALTAGMVLTVGCTKNPRVEPSKKPAVDQEQTRDLEGEDRWKEDFASGPEPKVEDREKEDHQANQGGGDASKIIIDTGDTGSSTPGSGGVGEGSRSGNSVDGGSGITYKKYEGTLDPSKIDEWVEADKTKRGSESGDWKYAFIPNEFLNDEKRANYARIGLSKAINSVAIDADDIQSPQDVSEGHGLVFAFNIKQMWGEQAQRKWQLVTNAQTKRVFSPAPQLRLQRFDGNKAVSAARLAYNVLHGGIYNALIDTPPRGQQLVRQIAGEVTARIGVQKAITYGPRYAQRRELKDRPGSYWESSDDFNGRRRELIWITGNPVPRFRGDGMVADYGTVAAEAWAHMKNGLVTYYIWGNANQERSKAELSFVRDPMNNIDGQLVNGFCIFCHISGAQSAPNDMWKAIEEGRITGQRLEQAKSFWTDNKDLAAQYAEDRKIFQTAMQKIVLGISDAPKEFNEAVIIGADPKEPCYTLVSVITGNRNGGDTTGLRNRTELEENQGQNNNGRRGFGLTGFEHP